MSDSKKSDAPFSDYASHGPHDHLHPDASSLRPIARSMWWILCVRGILGIVFGIIALIAPGAALVGIVFVFASFIIIDGLFSITHGIGLSDRAKGWGWLVAQGVVSVIAGAIAMFAPSAVGALAALFVLWTIAFFAIVNGITGIPTALALAEGERRTVALAVSIATLAFGVLLAVLILSQPVVETVLGLIWVVGIWAIVAGILLLALGVQERKIAKSRLA